MLTLSACESLAANGQVTVAEILTAVNEALNGCPEGASGTISGTAVKGPVSNATVSALAIGSNGAQGAQIGSAVTDASGNFTMQVGDYTGPVMLEMMGGSFSDEATGTHMEMGATDMMTAVIPNMTAGATLDGIEITPLTSMAQRMAQNMSGGMTEANITQSNSAIGGYCDVSDILSVHPMDPTASGSGADADQDQRDYGMMMAAMSEYASTIGMPSTSGMVTAMMDDASDGIMNGMMGGTRIDMGGMGGMMGGTMMQSDAGTSGLSQRDDILYAVDPKQIGSHNARHAGTHRQTGREQRSDPVARPRTPRGTKTAARPLAPIHGSAPVWHSLHFISCHAPPMSSGCWNVNPSGSDEYSRACCWGFPAPESCDTLDSPW